MVVISLMSLVTGCVCCNVIGGDYTGSWLIKFDADGHMVWKKFYNDNYMQPLADTPDGGLFVTGYSDYSTVTKLDSAGNLQWKHHYNETEPWPISLMMSISDSSYVIRNENGKVAGIDGDGNLKWSNDFNARNRWYSFSTVPGAENEFVVAGEDRIAWLDCNGNTVHQDMLKSASYVAPLLYVAGGGDCFVAYRSDQEVYFARYGKSGDNLWSTNFSGHYSPAALYEWPQGQLNLVYGDAGKIDTKTVFYDSPELSKLHLNVTTFDYDGQIQSDRALDPGAVFALANEGKIAYASFSTGSIAEMAIWPGISGKTLSVRLVLLNASGGEQWNSTADVQESMHFDNPGILTREVKSVTPTSDGGYIVQVCIKTL
jgi:hypothetical protein